MRILILLFLNLFCYTQHTIAQANPTDSLRKLKKSKSSLSIEIEAGLKRIMEEYRYRPNTEDTWTSIRNDADNLLYTYYKKRRLIGNRPQEAYFIKIGLETMTVENIAANKKVLIAGISEFKPAEFMIITLETEPVKKVGNL